MNTISNCLVSIVCEHAEACRLSGASLRMTFRIWHRDNRIARECASRRLWCDCMIGLLSICVRPEKPLWERVERENIPSQGSIKWLLAILRCNFGLSTNTPLMIQTWGFPHWKYRCNHETDIQSPYISQFRVFPKNDRNLIPSLPNPKTCSCKKGCHRVMRE